jgi:hypothetical protein
MAAAEPGGIESGSEGAIRVLDHREEMLDGTAKSLMG